MSDLTLDTTRIGLLRLAVLMLKRDRERSSQWAGEYMTGQAKVDHLVRLGDDIRELAEIEDQLEAMHRAVTSTGRPATARITVGG